MHLRTIIVSFTSVVVLLLVTLGVSAQDQGTVIEEATMAEEITTPLINFSEAQQVPSKKLSPAEETLKIGRKLIREGKLKEAREFLGESIKFYPSDADLRFHFARLLWHLYTNRGEPEVTLQESSVHAFEAVRLSVKSGHLNSYFAALVSEISPRAGTRAEFNEVFRDILESDTNGLLHLYFAKGLSGFGDPQAEFHFLRAIEISNGEIGFIDYSEWLLGSGRDREMLDFTRESAESHYIHFLRGFAFERTGDNKAAAEEYELFLQRGSLVSMPFRFKIHESRLQASILFEESRVSSPVTATQTVTLSQSLKGLSYLITEEAGGEGRAAQVAVGWVVRNRVLRGAVASGSPREYCPGQQNTGATLAEKYKSVICSGEFDGTCDPWCDDPSTSPCTENPGIGDVASNVYSGYKPDPVGSHCPGGIVSTTTNYCTSTTSCWGNTNTYRIGGGLFFWADSGSCPSDPPNNPCTVPTLAGKTCGNGGYDNCFYRHSWYSTFTTYQQRSCTITQGTYCSSPEITSSGETLYAHLEGPEGKTTDVDFELYLQKKNSNGTWSNVGNSVRLGSVEDIKYVATAGTYRWRAYARLGSGAFKLYSSK